MLACTIWIMYAVRGRVLFGFGQILILGVGEGVDRWMNWGVINDFWYCFEPQALKSE